MRVASPRCHQASLGPKAGHLWQVGPPQSEEVGQLQLDQVGVVGSSWSRHPAAVVVEAAVGENLQELLGEHPGTSG